MGKQKRDFSPPWNSKRSCSNTKVLNWLCSRESRGRMSASWAPFTQLWAPLLGQRQNQSLWCTTTTPSTGDVDVPDQMRGRTPLKAKRWSAAVFYNILDLAGITSSNPEESPAGAGRGAEGRIHGGESGRGSRHRVGSSRTNHRSSRHRDRGSADRKEL